MADLFVHNVKQDDLVVMGSDGVFDNLFDQDILACLPNNTKECKVQDAATCLANKSLDFSKRGDWYDSPFSVNARKHKKKYPGGKEDDITVVVSKVHIHSD